jgi:hypothetical protein
MRAEQRPQDTSTQVTYEPCGPKRALVDQAVHARQLHCVSWAFNHCSLKRVPFRDLKSRKLPESDFKKPEALRPLLLG